MEVGDIIPVRPSLKTETASVSTDGRLRMPDPCLECELEGGLSIDGNVRCGTILLGEEAAEESVPPDMAPLLIIGLEASEMGEGDSLRVDLDVIWRS